MAFESEGGGGGLKESPGGHVFGIEGWHWPAPAPTSITFFLDGSAMVADQFGRPIRGADCGGRRYYFATTAPSGELRGQDIALTPYQSRQAVDENRRKVRLASHQEVIEALTAERVDWTTLTWAGLPQLTYDELVSLPGLPLIGEEELRRIPDKEMRKHAIRWRRKVEEDRRADIEVPDLDE